jgi:hypothetical protein
MNKLLVERPRDFFDLGDQKVIIDFEEIVQKQLQKGLLKVNDKQNHKFKLPLPYLYTGNTRVKFFPGYKRYNSNAFMNIPQDYKTSSYSLYKRKYTALYYDINDTLGNELKKALNNLGYNYDSNNNKIEYIECTNCDTNNSIIEIAFKFDNDPQQQVPEAGRETEEAEEAEEAEEETTKEAEEAEETEETEETTKEPEEEKDELRVGGRKSKRRKSKRRKSKRRKSKRRKSKRRKSKRRKSAKKSKSLKLK